MLKSITQSLSRWRGERIVVAMSGGVDSAVAAGLLHLAGAEVVGVHMRVWHYDNCDADDLNGKIATCCSPADAADARAVADEMGFPFYSIDFQTDFRRAVIDPFIRDYLNARTPNPCVHCNTKLKLGTLLAKAKSYGANYVATGHYARVDRERNDGALDEGARDSGGRIGLSRAADRAKDQTYYLFELRQNQLRHLVMPLGELTKADTRSIARELGLALAEKAESQDICFVPDGNYRKFIEEETDLDFAAIEGEIVDATGRVLGRHGGIHNFTIGQRKGLGVSHPTPLYVVDIDAESRRVVVGGDDDLASDSLSAYGVNWIGIDPPDGPIPVLAQIRYRHKPVPATLRPVDPESSARTQIEIEFDRPERAVTPGQAVVCYDRDSGTRILAGGWIKSGVRRPVLASGSVDTAGAER